MGGQWPGNIDLGYFNVHVPRWSLYRNRRRTVVNQETLQIRGWKQLVGRLEQSGGISALGLWYCRTFLAFGLIGARYQLVYSKGLTWWSPTEEGNTWLLRRLKITWDKLTLGFVTFQTLLKFEFVHCRSVSRRCSFFQRTVLHNNNK